jgi:hypothetical protein
MAETRPSGLPIVSDSSALVTQEVAEIDKRGRLHVLPRWARRIAWLQLPAEQEIHALFVFSEPGRLSLCRWDLDGPEILARYEEISRNPDDSELEVLRLIQDRYNRVVIGKESRVYLGDAALAHLGLPIARGIKSIVYVAIFPNRIDVLGPSYRNAKLEASDARLDDLP